MSGVNKVILLGRLGKDPEVRTLENGAVVANFSLATTEVYRDRVSGERKESTEWHNIVFWRQLAETASKFLHKGDQCYIEGKIRTRSYEKEGTTRYVTEIVGDSLTLLGGRRDGQGGAPAQQNSSNASSEGPSQTAGSTTEGGDGLPF